MNADLERLIALQRIDSAIHDAEHRLADEPARITALDSRLEDARQHVAAARDAVAGNAAARRDIEKDVSLHQGRLSKFRDQAMNVKTNQEYHAIQHEIAFAQNEIKGHEDRMLERMLEADDLATGLKAAEAGLATAQKEVDAEKRAITVEHDLLRDKLEALKAERAGVVGSLTPEALTMFEGVAKRRHGVAMAEAKDGICTICHVRLRPQVFNTVRRNEAVIQCDTASGSCTSCRRARCRQRRRAGVIAPAIRPAASRHGDMSTARRDDSRCTGGRRRCWPAALPTSSNWSIADCQPSKNACPGVVHFEGRPSADCLATQAGDQRTTDAAGRPQTRQPRTPP